ncbi:hypothetical protein DVJ78_18265 (plasmid) [Humibacter sp. BT305]|nr:hypothetical protein DVJ78_18265 [Humibacter sp. BT305]
MSERTEHEALVAAAVYASLFFHSVGGKNMSEADRALYGVLLDQVEEAAKRHDAATGRNDLRQS